MRPYQIPPPLHPDYNPWQRELDAQFAAWRREQRAKHLKRKRAEIAVEIVWLLVWGGLLIGSYLVWTVAR